MTTKDIKFWLEEAELKTPEHDKIVLWCLQNSEEIIKSLDINKISFSYNFRSTIGNINESQWNYNTKEFLSDNIKLKETVENLYKEFISQKLDEAISYKKRLEFKLPNVYNLGFIDLAFFPEDKTHLFSKRLNNHLGLGFSFSLSQLNDLLPIYLEIKPNIKSIGEVMRQINYYRANTDKGIFILVTKTKGLKDIFKEQDVLIYEYGEEK